MRPAGIRGRATHRPARGASRYCRSRAATGLRQCGAATIVATFCRPRSPSTGLQPPVRWSVPGADRNTPCQSGVRVALRQLKRRAHCYVVVAARHRILVDDHPLAGPLGNRLPGEVSAVEKFSIWIRQLELASDRAHRGPPSVVSFGMVWNRSMPGFTKLTTLLGGTNSVSPPQNFWKSL